MVKWSTHGCVDHSALDRTSRCGPLFFSACKHLPQGNPSTAVIRLAATRDQGGDVKS